MVMGLVDRGRWMTGRGIMEDKGGVVTLPSYACLLLGLMYLDLERVCN